MILHRLIAVLVGVGLLASSSAYAADSSVPATREQVTLTFAPVVKRVAPAVVNIYTKKVVQNQGPFFAEDPFFRHFFSESGPFSQQRVQNSLGSGVIVRSSGMVITNNHVAGDADQITVVLADRREFAAKVVGKDEALRSRRASRFRMSPARCRPWTSPTPTTSLRWATSCSPSVTPSASARPSPWASSQASPAPASIISDIQSFIQTDAAINPGNSGGAS